MSVLLSLFAASAVWGPVRQPILPEAKVLLMSATKGYRHDSIPAGLEAISRLCEESGIGVDRTEDASKFTSENLKQYSVVVFLSTTGDILDPGQQIALRRFMLKGGGYVGIHAAADTEYDWSWYRELVGAWFLSHPAIQDAKIEVVDRTHLSTKHLPPIWARKDEWYDFRALPPGDANVLLKLDNASYQGSKMGDNHPIAWCREVDGGRSFYTGGGHTKESYAEPDFLKHLLGGILWVLHRESSGTTPHPFQSSRRELGPTG